MPTFLQACAARAAAQTAYEKAAKASKAAPGDAKKLASAQLASAALLAAFDAEIALSDDPTLKPQHRAAIEARVIHYRKSEEKTVEKDEPPPSKDARSAISAKPTGEGEESSSGDSGEDSSPSTAKSAPAKSAPAKKAKKAKAEEEDGKRAAAADKAPLPKGWSTAHKAYKERAIGLDAYGIHGPAALYRACAKATGQTSLPAILGALGELPKRLAAAEKIESRVATLESDQKTIEVNALVDRAKLEGRTTGKDHRKKLRALGMTHGAEHLRGILSMLPKQVRTDLDGQLQPRVDANGRPVGGPSREDQEEAKMIEANTINLAPEQKAQWIADYRAAIAKAMANHAPGH